MGAAVVGLGVLLEQAALWAGAVLVLAVVIGVVAFMARAEDLWGDELAFVLILVTPVALAGVILVVVGVAFRL